MNPLELLHKKLRELGTDEVRKLLPQMHTNRFGAIVAGVNPIPENILEKMNEHWSRELNPPDIDTTEISSKLAANQLSFTILSAVRNSYDPATVGSIVGIIRRTGCGWIQRSFDSMIARSRNILAGAFLRSDYEWSFWIDDDMVIPNGEPNWFRMTSGVRNVQDEFAGLIAPYQLASWGDDKKLVSAVYFSRHGSPNITAGFESGTSLKNRLPFKGLLPARYCGFGCVMVHRQVYEDILQIHPNLWKDKTGECQVFSTFESEGRMVGEDEALCIRAKEAGHDTFLDMSVVAGHVGRKVNYIPEGVIK